MRAVSTRRWHRCEVTPNTLTTDAVVEHRHDEHRSPRTARPVSRRRIAGSTSRTTRSPGDHGVGREHDHVCAAAPCAGAPSAANAVARVRHRLHARRFEHRRHDLRVRPRARQELRVVVYKATGSSYARTFLVVRIAASCVVARALSRWIRRSPASANTSTTFPAGSLIIPTGVVVPGRLRRGVGVRPRLRSCCARTRG